MIMTAPTMTPSRLSNLQAELLKLYPYDVSDGQIQDIRTLLADYFARQIDTEMNRLWETNGWDQHTIEQWKTEHLRSSSAS
jgi:hypothetical protein